MDDERDPNTGQHPHTPGQDPQGTGAPHDAEARPSDPQNPQGAAPVVPESQRKPRGDDEPDDEGDAPLGGDESTEDRLDAATAVDEDALKALAPDDTPA